MEKREREDGHQDIRLVDIPTKCRFPKLAYMSVQNSESNAEYLIVTSSEVTELLLQNLFNSLLAICIVAKH